MVYSFHYIGSKDRDQRRESNERSKTDKSVTSSAQTNKAKDSPGASSLRSPPSTTTTT